MIAVTCRRIAGHAKIRAVNQSDRFPVGAAVTLRELDENPHPVLARLRASEPVSWLPCLEGWLITRHDLVVAAMRDSATFTVDDPRFSTAQVVGPSMLSLDGSAHERHRTPFVGPFRPGEVAGRFAQPADRIARELARRLARAPGGRGDLRRDFAGPIAAAMMAAALGFAPDDPGELLTWYGAIVASVTAITAGDPPTAEGAAAYAQLAERLQATIDGRDASLPAVAARAGDLTRAEVIANAAVLLFGGIETMEGMIANATLALLRHPALMVPARRDAAVLDGVIDESLRLEPAAAVIDRYATADTRLGDAVIGRGDLVRISLAGANRDPDLFVDPDRFDPARPHLRRHVAFAHGPHVCVGVHLARLETRTALRALLDELPGLRLDPDRPATVRGLVFRKPASLHARWDVSPARP